MPSALVPKKFKAGRLHSGSKSGPLVTNPKQMVAIMLSEKQAEQETGSADRTPRMAKPTRRRSS
jgi:hypothetical protein